MKKPAIEAGFATGVDGVAADSGGDRRVQRLLQGCLPLGSDHLGYHLTLPEDQEGWNATDAELHRQVLLDVYVDLPDGGLADVLVRQFIEDRSDHPAGATPFGPKINQDRMPRLQDLLGEVLFGDGKNILGGHGSGGGREQEEEPCDDAEAHDHGGECESQIDGAHNGSGRGLCCYSSDRSR